MVHQPNGAVGVTDVMAQLTDDADDDSAGAILEYALESAMPFTRAIPYNGITNPVLLPHISSLLRNSYSD